MTINYYTPYYMQLMNKTEGINLENCHKYIKMYN